MLLVVHIQTELGREKKGERKEKGEKKAMGAGGGERGKPGSLTMNVNL